MQEIPRREVVTLYIAFFFTGITTVLLGPVLPELAQRFGLSAGQLAWFFPAQFAGSALGSTIAGRWRQAALIGGYFAMAFGLAVLTLGGTWICLLGFLALGLGVGAASTATNLSIARGSAASRGARLAAVNFVWGGGAAISPLFYAKTQQWLGFSGAVYLLSGLLLGCLVAIVLALRSSASAPLPATATLSPEASAAATTAPSAGWRELWPFIAFFFLYVGSENAWGGWLVELAGKKEGSLDAYVIGSIYWTALLIGRGIAPIGLKWISEQIWMRASLVITLAGGILLLLAPGKNLLATGAALAGFGLAAIFPLLVSLLAAATTEQGKKEAGWVFAFTGAGGATLPWMVGAGAELAGGDVQIAFLVPLVAMILCVVILPRAEARMQPGVLR